MKLALPILLVVILVGGTSQKNASLPLAVEKSYFTLAIAIVETLTEPATEAAAE